MEDTVTEFEIHCCVLGFYLLTHRGFSPTQASICLERLEFVTEGCKGSRFCAEKLDYCLKRFSLNSI